MPIYEYKCPQCRDERKSLFYHVQEEHKPPYCQNCGGMMVKDYQAMQPLPIYEENDSVDFNLTGHPITYHTKGQLKEIAKRHGCSLWE